MQQPDARMPSRGGESIAGKGFVGFSGLGNND